MDFYSPEIISNRRIFKQAKKFQKKSVKNTFLYYRNTKYFTFV